MCEIQKNLKNFWRALATYIFSIFGSLQCKVCPMILIGPSDAVEECPEKFLEKVQKSMGEFQKKFQKILARARHVYFFDFRISTMQSVCYDTDWALRRCERVPRTMLRKRSKICG